MRLVLAPNPSDKAIKADKADDADGTRTPTQPTPALSSGSPQWASQESRDSASVPRRARGKQTVGLAASSAAEPASPAVPGPPADQTLPPQAANLQPGQPAGGAALPADGDGASTIGRYQAQHGQDPKKALLK